jgi:hypothetical protein
MKDPFVVMAACISVAACSTQQPGGAADLNGAFTIAAAGAAAYSAQASADPKATAIMRELLSAAQAALVTWMNSPTPGDQAAVNAAIAALVAYEAAAKPS